MPSPISCSPTSSCARDEFVVDTFVKTFVLGTVCVNAFGLAVYFTGTDETFRFVTGSGRLASFMDNPNANANVIALTLPLLLYLWFARKWRRIYVLVSLAILAYALVAASSVGGLLWSLAGVMVFFALTINWRVLVGLAVCAAVAIPLLDKYGPSVLPEAFQVRVLGAMQSGNIEDAGTFSFRMGLIHEALDVVDDQILFGLGADQYRATSDLGAPVHDVYLLLWAEGGLPALIGWLMLPQIIALMALWTFVRPSGRLVGATTLAVVTVFLLAATGNSAHVRPLLGGALAPVHGPADGLVGQPPPTAVAQGCGRAARAPLGAPPASAPQPSASVRDARAALTRRDTRTHRCKDRGNRTWPRST